MVSATNPNTYFAIARPAAAAGFAFYLACAARADSFGLP